MDKHTKSVILKQCEAIIAEGLEAMSKVDRALSIIDEMELYADTFDSFPAYCQTKWHINDQYNYIFIKTHKKQSTFPFQQNNITRRIYESRQQVSITTK